MGLFAKLLDLSKYEKKVLSIPFRSHITATIKVFSDMTKTCFDNISVYFTDFIPACNNVTYIVFFNSFLFVFFCCFFLRSFPNLLDPFSPSP